MRDWRGFCRGVGAFFSFRRAAAGLRDWENIKDFHDKFDGLPPPQTFAMSAEVAPFRFFPVTTLKKSARPGAPSRSPLSGSGRRRGLRSCPARRQAASQAKRARLAPVGGDCSRPRMKDEGGSVNPLGFRLFAPGRSGNVARGRYAEHAFWKRRARARCF